MGISLTLRSHLPSALPRPQTYPSEAVAHALCADPIFVVGDLATEGVGVPLAPSWWWRPSRAGRRLSGRPRLSPRLFRHVRVLPLPAILADELGADWGALRLETAPYAPAYRNPRHQWDVHGQQRERAVHRFGGRGAAGRRPIGSARRCGLSGFGPRFAHGILSTDELLARLPG